MQEAAKNLMIRLKSKEYSNALELHDVSQEEEVDKEIVERLDGITNGKNETYASIK